MALLLIVLVFTYAYSKLSSELEYVRTLADYLAYDAIGGGEKPASTLKLDKIRDEVEAVRASTKHAWANRGVQGWEMRVQRLEPALAFWVDLLRQIGLLFTVVGLGLSITAASGDVTDLLQPMGLAVWTTVAGLSLSILLTARFGTKMAAWTDVGEKNIMAWQSMRLRDE